MKHPNFLKFYLKYSNILDITADNLKHNCVCVCLMYSIPFINNKTKDYTNIDAKSKKKKKACEGEIGVRNCFFFP